MNNDNIPLVEEETPAEEPVEEAPLIDEKFIQSIWDKLQTSNSIVNQTSDLPKDIKDRNIIYIVHCSVWDKDNDPSEEEIEDEDENEETLEKYDFLKIGVSKNGDSRLRRHINGKSGILNHHIRGDDDFKKFIKEDDHKDFIKKYCLIQFYRFNDEENKIIAKMDNDYDDSKELEKELKKWQDYWKNPKERHGIAGPVEYVEKPIERLLKAQRLLKYPPQKL